MEVQRALSAVCSLHKRGAEIVSASLEFSLRLGSISVVVTVLEVHLCVQVLMHCVPATGEISAGVQWLSRY